MPRIRCRCGEVLRYSDIPNEIEWLFISDVAYDAYVGTIDAENLYHAMKHALLCPTCGRLWLFWNGFNAQPQEFVPHLDNDNDGGGGQG